MSNAESLTPIQAAYVEGAAQYERAVADIRREAVKRHSFQVERAIENIVNSGVSLDRLSLRYLPDGVTQVCVDSVPRAEVRTTFNVRP